MYAQRLQWTELFTSVVDVWIIWAVSATVFALCLRHALKNCRWRRVGEFVADERGASYALSYVMTFPAYLILMCLMIQATLILMVKLGTVYAAHAAARTAIVWRPSQPERPNPADEREEYALEKAHRAAALAMAPFASGLQHHLDKTFPFASLNVFAQADASAYYRIYQRVGSYNAQQDSSPVLAAISRWDPDALALERYVKNKVLFAYAATQVEFTESQIPAWNEDFEVKVTYSMPMHIPAVGRCFGDWSRPFFARDIESTVSLPSEAPESSKNRLTIPYDPKNLVSLW